MKIIIETLGWVGLEEISFYVIFTREYYGNSIIENDILINSNKDNQRILSLE